MTVLHGVPVPLAHCPRGTLSEHRGGWSWRQTAAPRAENGCSELGTKHLRQRVSGPILQGTNLRRAQSWETVPSSGAGGLQDLTSHIPYL